MLFNKAYRRVMERGRDQEQMYLRDPGYRRRQAVGKSILIIIGLAVFSIIMIAISLFLF